MTTELPFRLVDAFTVRAYNGNPAGVVLGTDGLSDGQLQAIAREINASETAFLSRLNDLHRPPQLRWFTPTTEVDFCGHATLAAAHALWEWAVLEPDAGGATNVTLATRAGDLGITAEWLPDAAAAPVWWLQMPPVTLTPERSNPVKLCQLLGLTPDELDDGLPLMRTQDRDTIAFIRDWNRLQQLQPRFDELGAWCERQQIRGVCVATTSTLSPAVHVHSRFFAPAVGINEDPVTGSVHGPLAALLVTAGAVPRAEDHAAIVCAQGLPGRRTGLLRAVVRGTADAYEISIGGQCQTTLAGNLHVPPL